MTVYEYLTNAELIAHAYTTLTADDALAFELLVRLEALSDFNMAELESRVNHGDS